MGDRPEGEPIPIREGRTPFGALVAAACSDAGAAEGLAAAYAALDVDGRRRLVAAVADDARREGVSASVALAALLPAEVDPAIAASIFEAMHAAGGEGLRSDEDARARLRGDAETGAAVLVRPLYGTFVEVFALSWEHSVVTSAVVEPLIERERVDRTVAASLRASELTEAPFSRAVERVAHVIWSHLRRHGALPAGAERFADLL